MDLKLQLLESFTARGSDGADYKVCAYDRLARDPSVPGEHWESTGQVEYRLADGRVVQLAQGGAMEVAGSGLQLQAQDRRFTVH